MLWSCIIIFLALALIALFGYLYMRARSSDVQCHFEVPLAESDGDTFKEVREIKRILLKLKAASVTDTERGGRSSDPDLN